MIESGIEIADDDYFRKYNLEVTNERDELKLQKLRNEMAVPLFYNTAA